MAEAASRELARSAARREEILDAAVAAFADYGYRRASLDDIARGASCSRTALYHYFRNKEEIFRATIEALLARTLESARAAIRDEPSLRDRLVGALRSRVGTLHALLSESRHGPELLEETNRRTGDLVVEGQAEFRKLLATTLRDGGGRGEIDLRGRGFTAGSAALFLVRCAEGLKSGDPRPAPRDLERSLVALVEIFLRGVSR